MREFGPICASSPVSNSQITDNNTNINQTDFVDADNNNNEQSVTCIDNSNETELQRQRIQSSSCQIMCANEQLQPEHVHMTNIKDVIESSHGDKITIANFARNDTQDNNNNPTTTTTTTTTSNLIKFNDDDNDCYNNFRSSDSSTTTGNETNQINVD